MKNYGQYISIIGSSILVLFFVGLTLEDLPLGRELKEMNWPLYTGLILIAIGLGLYFFHDKPSI